MTRVRRIPVPTAWHRQLYRAIGWLMFNRLTVRPADRAPPSGAVLYVGLHRNGMLDASAYLPRAPRAAHALSAHLRRTWLLRAAFPGIRIRRRHDHARGTSIDRDHALERCAQHLRRGGELLVLPEGHSTLGPVHLPFRDGAARIAQKVSDAGSALAIVPLAVHYEHAWSWQSRGEVVVGEPLHISASSGLDDQALQTQITEALERVGVQFRSAEAQRQSEVLAFAATLESAASYASCLARLAPAPPAALLRALLDVEHQAYWSGAWTFQHLPLMPRRGWWREAAELTLLSLPVFGMVLLNVPVLLLAFIAGRRLAHHDHAVSSSRAYVGVPSGLCWAIGLSVWLVLRHGVLFALAYALITLVGIRLVRPFKLRAVAIHNAMLAPRVRAPLETLRAELRAWLDRGRSCE